MRCFDYFFVILPPFLIKRCKIYGTFIINHTIRDHSSGLRRLGRILLFTCLLAQHSGKINMKH
jgi:hypothetical protein